MDATCAIEGGPHGAKAPPLHRAEPIVRVAEDGEERGEDLADLAGACGAGVSMGMRCRGEHGHAVQG